MGSEMVALIRTERAATAWSMSIASAAATAVMSTRRPARGTSGAATAPAIRAC